MKTVWRLTGCVYVLLGSACSVLPGLHVGKPGSESVSLERRTQPDGSTQYVGQSGGELIGYRVVEVTGQSLAQIRAGTEITLPPLPGMFSAVTAGQGALEYRIGPGDIVLITVWEHPELSAPLGDRTDVQNAGRLVSADGLMFYPYVGEFKAAGMTALELRQFIAQKLSRVINNPQVDARVVGFRSQRVQVSGDVRDPGVVALDDKPKGVMEAIAERGGLTEQASRRRVYLTRGGISYPLDLAGMLSGERTVMNPQLVAGDVVHVPDRSNDLVFVLGEVDKQVQVALQQGKTTLTEALTAAGGLDRLRANDSGVLVFRRPFAEGLLPTIYSLSLDSPLGLLLAGEFVLQPRDVVYVKTTDFAQYNSLINQLLPTISAVFQLDRLVTRR
ncbi:polysaccharide biosynthesis/export family protein [Fontimonas sp. SYSU GA230001]|uniref:polysaccharide biosynthesis/export family protein n=1 Tax=Fontimonas sp. SYSU GA230001 TaxID=3142450 RepID=UPI0032B4A3D7